MEQWASTRDTKEAAAFGTLGMIIRPGIQVDSKTNNEIVRFRISLTNLEKNMSTAKIRADYRSGRLEAKEPDHPLLVIYRAFINREKILDCANKGSRIQLTRHGRAVTWQYEDGEAGLPGVKAGQVVVKTGDVKVAAAFATIGLRLLKIEGTKPSFLFYLEGKSAQHDGAELLMKWRQDPKSIPWVHPFAQAMRGLFNRERVLDAVRQTERKILVRDPRSRCNRSAVISENASPKAWDRIHTFFK